MKCKKCGCPIRAGDGWISRDPNFHFVCEDCLYLDAKLKAQEERAEIKEFLQDVRFIKPSEVDSGKQKEPK